jgi:hypothetical protein
MTLQQLHVMDNDGPSQPFSPRAPFGYNATSDGWTQRNLLARAKSLADVHSIVAARAASTGGTCIAGCNIMIAQPPASIMSSGPAATAFVYEGDRMSGTYRLPNSSPPFTRSGSVIAVTNHYLNYGFDPAFPFRNFGVDLLTPHAPGGDFSTLWRYAAVSAAIVARDDASAASRSGLAFDDIRSMLQGSGAVAVFKAQCLKPQPRCIAPANINPHSNRNPVTSTCTSRARHRSLINAPCISVVSRRHRALHHHHRA